MKGRLGGVWFRFGVWFRLVGLDDAANGCGGRSGVVEVEGSAGGSARQARHAPFVRTGSEAGGMKQGLSRKGEGGVVVGVGVGGGGGV